MMLEDQKIVKTRILRHSYRDQTKMPVNDCHKRKTFFQQIQSNVARSTFSHRLENKPIHDENNDFEIVWSFAYY